VVTNVSEESITSTPKVEEVPSYETLVATYKLSSVASQKITVPHFITEFKMALS
jgi:hypothetical protein